MSARLRKAPLAAWLALALLTSACGGAGTQSLPPPPAAPESFLRPTPGRWPAGGPGATERAEILPASQSPVTFARMAKYPEPGWHVPRAIVHAPGGKLVTYLQSEKGSEQMALFAFDKERRESHLLLRASDVLAESGPVSREEELRRERQRQRIQGVTSYVWASKAPVLVLPLGGDVFLKKGDAPVVRLTDTPEPELDPKPCATGERVAFVRGSELVVLDVATRRETLLTRGAPAGVTRGQSDFVGQEEFGETSGFFWAPGCDRLAYLEVDERPVAEKPVLGYRGGKPDLMLQRYPASGATNPAVRVGIVELASRRTTWLSLPEGERYAGRFVFSPDGRTLYLQSLRRDQKELSLLAADVKTGKTRALFTDTSKSWVDLAPMRALEKSGALLWAGMRDGHRHIELRDSASGALVRRLTSGAWDVESIDGVDEERGRVLFTATREGPLERQLYAVPLAAGALSRLTPEPGVHRVEVDAAGGSFVDVHSAIDRLPKAVVRDPAGAVVGELPSPPDPDLAALRLRAPELVSLKGPSGETLHGALLRPRALSPGKKHPVVVMVYGGPGVQTVQNRWAPRLLWQHLADRGFVVFQLDNRGTPGRGEAFEGAISGKLGEAELADQLAGLDHLASLPFVDTTRVGIYGHSYGGFLAAFALLRAPDRFHVGIAGSPVTDWSLYDTGYTERYLGTPAQNPEGYAASELSRLARNLRGRLFVVHALMDENVHFQHSAQLIDALVAADKPFDMLVFPGERHGYRSPAARTYALRRVVDYLAENL